MRVCTHAKRVVDHACPSAGGLGPGPALYAAHRRSAARSVPPTPCAPLMEAPASKQVSTNSRNSVTPPRCRVCSLQFVLTNPCPEFQQCQASPPGCRTAPHCAARSCTLQWSSRIGKGREKQAAGLLHPPHPRSNTILGGAPSTAGHPPGKRAARGPGSPPLNAPPR